MSAFKRLAREIKIINDLSGIGIYYKQDMDVLTKGVAMIIGPKDSVYANCLLFFKFDFPSDYPFQPPTVTFLTHDGKTRFHPNLYRDGKVCLSILGTYSGPSWQSTMSFSMILLSLKTLLDKNPLNHEPGYETTPLTHTYALHYSLYVQYHIVKYTVNELIQRVYLHIFEHDIPHVLPQLKENLKTTITEQRNAKVDDYYSHVPYNMSGHIAWATLNLPV
jgi:ubiquitin-conjugating enzyme E2 Z